MTMLPLPASLDEKQLKYYRICNDCLTKMKRKQPRKPPTNRSTRHIGIRKQYTRGELRDAVAHDHTYSLPSPSVCSTMLTPATDSLSVSIMPLKKPVYFCIEMFENDKEAINCYTSFPSYAHLLVCYNFLGDSVNHLMYPGSSDNSMTRLVKHRSLPPLNEFFLTLCRLKRGLSEEDLAYRFQVSQSTVSRILSAWVNFLYRKFLEVPIWPSREQVNFLMPLI